MGLQAVRNGHGGPFCMEHREPGQFVRSGLHGDSRSRSQTVLEIEFITICFPNDILWS